MAVRVSPRGDGDGHARQQHADQRRQAQELVGALKRPAKLRPSVANALDALVGFDPVAEPVSECVDGVWRSGEQHAVTHPAARLDQTGTFEVREVDHHPRRNVEKVAAPVRFEAQHRADAKMPRADFDFVAHRNA